MALENYLSGSSSLNVSLIVILLISLFLGPEVKSTRIGLMISFLLHNNGKL